MADSKKVENVIQSMTPEQKQKNLISLNYIKTLASASSLDISKWDINKIFGVEGDEMNLVSDKKQLNKLFFDAFEKSKLKEEKKAEKNPKEEEPVQLMNIESLKKTVETSAKASRDRQVQLENANVASHERQMKSYLAEYTRYHDAYLLSLQNVRNLQNVTDNLGIYDKCFQDIQKLIDKKLWINPVFENGFLYLNTSCNIMLHEVNKAANLDIHLDFGQLAVRINVANNFAIDVIPYKNNIAVGNTVWHPHVYSNARPCWGEAETVAMKAIEKLDIAKALELLHSILNHYNGGSPITRIADFKINGQKMGRIADNFKHPDKRKPPKEKPTEPPVANVGAILQQAVTPATITIINDGY